MLQLFHSTCESCSRVVTATYSTSFFSAVNLLHKNMRSPVFNIYGFVRLADEIVDSFHTHDKPHLLADFKMQTYDAIERGISLNPILNSFQLTVNQYNIDISLVDAFLNSMEKDLTRTTYNCEEYKEYIFGSAEAVGLMCLTVFCGENKTLYSELQTPAKALGAAFQKVNFLRDIKDDFEGLSRMYFPGCDFNNFRQRDKEEIEEEIANDFQVAYKGIRKLPVRARFAVYVAYKYYLSLFNRIRRMKPERVLRSRVRIPNYRKAMIIFRAGVKNQLRLI